jgi:hypothetical protein
MRYSQLPKILSAVVLTASSSIAAAASPSAKDYMQDAVGQQNQAVVRAFVFQYLPREKSSSNPSSPSRGQAEAFVGREDLYVGRSFSTRPNCVPLDASPLEAIADRARKTNIVIVNEHHASPRDRSFIADMLSVLSSEGYSIYAAETFSRFADSSAHDGTRQDGFGWYSNEPIFARTVQIAGSLGYSYVAYEQTPDQAKAYAEEPANSPRRMNAREEFQAVNLVAAVFARDADAKVVIHVGHSHVREQPVPWAADDVVRMAQRLKSMTGRDPLTISQTECNSPSGSYVVAESFWRADGEKETASPVDLYIGHPQLTFQSGRPTWRQLTGDKAVDIPRAFLDANEPIIIEARPEGAGLGALPVDRVFLYPGERLPLLLPVGRYRIDGFFTTGRTNRVPEILEVN